MAKVRTGIPYRATGFKRGKKVRTGISYRATGPLFGMKKQKSLGSAIKPLAKRR